MNEQEYVDLCLMCDAVLLDPEATEETIAIGWLHIIREHPEFLKRYERVFSIGNKTGSTIWNTSQKIKYIASSVKNNTNKLLRKEIYNIVENDLPKDVDIVILSHLLTDRQFEEGKDFYFGDIPRKIADSNRSVLVLLVNHTKTRPCGHMRQMEKWGFSCIVLPQTLGFQEEIRLHTRLHLESMRLTSKAKAESEDSMNKKAIILRHAAIEAISETTKFNLRLSVLIEKIFKISQPKYFLTTYEGHAWERMVFAAARKGAPRITCFAYQHAAIFRLQHALKRPLANCYNPDTIYTVGSITQSILEKEYQLFPINISLLGSNRSSNNIDTNNISHSIIKKIREGERRTCLIAPEGILDECLLMLDFSLECAKLNCEMKFIWRFHPLTPYSLIISRFPQFRNIPENIEISKNSIEEDIRRSIWVLYRGSTTAIQACRFGLRPIYLKIEGEMTIDPLYELGKCRAHVSSQSEISEAFSRDISREPEHLLKEIHESVAYCCSYYEPIRLEKLLNDLTH